MTPEQLATLSTRVNESDLASLPDWQVSDILNSPDNSLPTVIALVPTKIGPGQVMEALGADAGAAFLDVIESLSSVSRPVFWAMTLVKGEGINAASITFRQQLDQLAASNRIPVTSSQKIKALAESHKTQSWAEYHQIEVTPRTVGLARGGR